MLSERHGACGSSGRSLFPSAGPALTRSAPPESAGWPYARRPYSEPRGSRFLEAPLSARPATLLPVGRGRDYRLMHMFYFHGQKYKINWKYYADLETN